MTRTKAAAGAALLLLVAAARVAGADPNPSVTCDRNADKLSVSATQVQLTALLNEIAARCVVETKVEPEADRAVSVKFSNLSVEEGLRSISEDSTQNYVFFYTVADKGVRRVKTLHLYSNGRPGGGGLASSAPAPAAVAPASPAPPPAPVAATPAKVVTGLAEPDSQTSPPDNEDTPRARLAAKEKLEARLATLPPDQRDRVLKLEAERQKRREQRDAARARMLQERQRQQTTGERVRTNIPTEGDFQEGR